MRKTLVAATIALAGAASLAAVPSVQAGGLHQGYYGEGFRPIRPYFYPPSYHRTFYAPPVALYGYGYRPVTFVADCGWIKRRAVHTQNPYWWARYHRCRGF